MSATQSGSGPAPADVEARLERAERELAELVERAARARHQATLDVDAAVERAQRAEARVAELEAVVDSLGRERSALRSDLGAMRARLEVLAAAEGRVAILLRQLDELRLENERLQKELARAKPAKPPPPPGRGK